MDPKELTEHNLRHWKKHADIDPRFTKPITGKPYRGTSPNPQYVIQCLTDLFGPVGEGFGWEVVAEEFTPLGGEVLHWCRIRFWHTNRANTFDSYGQTKAAYTTGNGKVMVDEDAPKKSLTDAIIKAASHIGIAANIFLGRWDDQKYVQQVAQEHREKDQPAPAQQERPAQAAKPSQQPNGQTAKARALADEMIAAAKAHGIDAVTKHRNYQRDIAFLETTSPDDFDRVMAALNPPAIDDQIPYEGK